MDPLDLMLIGCSLMGARPGSLRLRAVCDLRAEAA